MVDDPIAEARARLSLAGPAPIAAEGRVVAARQDLIGVRLAGLRLGDTVSIARSGLAPLLAEVIALEEDHGLAAPLSDPRGVAREDPVSRADDEAELAVGPSLLGRVLDGHGRARDGGPAVSGPLARVPRHRRPPDPMLRAPIARPFVTGLRLIDSCLTLGVGQRVGLFAGPGAGKSTLTGAIVRHAQFDVAVVALIGERGREVRSFLDDTLGAARARAVTVVATSDEPAAMRVRAAHTALSVAEHFRDQGRHVLLVFDSLTRVARAQRELGLAAGEAVTRRGFPPSVFGLLPRLIERCGMSAEGAITAVMTVLVEGPTLDDPIAEEALSVLDGHLVLRGELLTRGQSPPVDVVASVSRTMPQVTAEAQRDDAATLKRWLAAHEERRDLIALGAYARGSDPTTDAALARWPLIESFLRQGMHRPDPFDESLAALAAVVRPGRREGPP
ncbi:MAG: FliI/YscN family ATPase [Myxococcales bacterium]|nr:FliI/YscN family ATPase [Myxococcales bacterium]